ncbi:MAG: UDP-N-acetylmuramate dehydrogenase [Clostridia bacterium]|nr:UDP-N-acetylmuramate dehydrogenase [Clostridia bacterium]
MRISDVAFEVNFSFAKNTTYGCGGCAKIAYFPTDINQAIFVYDYLVKENIKFVTLGNGSDVLASDGGFDGAVISTKNLKGIVPISENSLFCFAGTTVSELLKYCVLNGCGGLEYLAGIPASVGGLLYMNGGAFNKHIGDNTLSVKFYDGNLHDLSNKKCKFGHKYSTMQDINSLIIGAELIFEPKTGDRVKKDIDLILTARGSQPKGKSCGCVFKNYGEISAGKIIDEAGLKGLSNGGAKVSEEHANFIINCGNKSADVYKLIKEVKRRVYDSFGVCLEEEVVYIGDFNDTNG